MLHLISTRKIACERYVRGTWLPVSEITILIANYNTHFTLYKRLTIRVLLGKKALIKC